MCSAITTDCRYDNSNNKPVENVYSPKSMCSGILFVPRKAYQSHDRSIYQYPQCTFTCQVRNVPFVDRVNSFFLKCDQGLFTFEETQKSIPDVFENDICPGA